MTYLDEGIAQIHSLLRGNTGSVADYVTFAQTSLTNLSGSETISDITEVSRVPLVWSATGSNSLFVADLPSGSAIGSPLTSFGLVTGSTIGTNQLHSLNLSTLGSKTALFSISLQGEVIITRA